MFGHVVVVRLNYNILACTMSIYAGNFEPVLQELLCDAVVLRATNILVDNLASDTLLACVAVSQLYSLMFLLTLCAMLVVLCTRQMTHYCLC
jgi:hypothetical protein